MTPFRPRSVKELIHEMSESPDWLFHGLVPKGVLGLLVAYPKVGKSTLAAQAAAPEFARALLLGELAEDWQARAQAVGAAGLNVGRRKLTAAGAVAVKRAGYALAVWTVNDPDEARALIGMGADCIITDQPDVILRALGD